MANQISPKFHYYLEDLKCIYYGCHGLSYGKEGQTLFIDNESSKAIQNSKWSGVFFLNHLRDKCCQKKGAMVGFCISFVATFGWIAIGQNDSSSL